MKCPWCNGTGDVEASMGAKIKTLRIGQMRTQEELAIASGLGRAQIANIEVGRTDVPTKTLIRIADALGVKAGELLP